MHIVYLLDVFPKISETFVLNEILELKKAGVRISPVALNHSNEELIHDEAQALAHAAFYLPANGFNKKKIFQSAGKLIRRHPVRFLRTVIFLLKIGQARSNWAFRQSLPLAVELEHNKIDHIHCHFAAQAAEYGMYVSMISGIPYSFTAHAYDIYVQPYLLREKMDNARFVVTVCDYNIEYLKRYHPHFSANKIHKIVCGVNVRDFQPVDIIKANNGILQIVTVGRLVEKKGLRYLIEAISNLDFPVECNIIGEGSERKLLQSLIQKYGLEEKVFLLGSKNKQQIQRELSLSELFVLPCIVTENGDRDAMPVVLKEAMAMQLPIIATSEVAIPEIVKPEAGYLVEPKNASQLAEAIEKFYSLSEEQKIKMGRQGRELIVEFSNIEKETEKLRRLFLA